MSEEVAARLPGFRPGIPVLMADGIPWHLPLPDDVDATDADYQAILRELEQGDSLADRQLGESILTIFLLQKNYNITPSRIRRLLGVGATAGYQGDLTVELHRVASIHLGEEPPPFRDPVGVMTRTVA